MTNNNTTQLGYFIDRQLWKDGLALLNFQIDQKKKNKHFNTLSMFYYDKLDKKLMFDEEYFDIKISNSLFYGLKKEFDVMPYVIPKTGLGLGLRNYKFFTYPMRVVYYAVGLYLFRLSEEFLNNDSKGNERIKAYYGGSLSYQENKIQLNNSDKIYYRNHYKEFKSECKKEGALLSQDRKILKLDIENYFDELSISRLLELLGDYVKPTKQVEMHYDTFTREQIGFFFKFISRGKSGIPQSDNDIISSFIGYLYLVFGDLCIDDILGRMRMKDGSSVPNMLNFYNKTSK
jgi:AbiA family abortive infection protein